MLHSDVKPLVTSQALLYSPTSPHNVDDILDIGAYGEHVYVTYSEYYLLPLESIGIEVAAKTIGEGGADVDYKDTLDI